MTPGAAAKKQRKFDLQTFLSTIDGGRTIATFPEKRTIFVSLFRATRPILFSICRREK
jgi:hypothetical protein